MVWEEEAHPRGATGTATGGQFVAADSGKSSAKSTSGGKSSRGKSGSGGGGSSKASTGTMAYDPKTGRGPGYGVKGGDPRVRALQAALTRLGLTDGAGKKLVRDGMLGPKTTRAIKAAQRRLGLPADGKVTPALLAKLVKLRELPKAPPRAKESAWAGVPLSEHPSAAVRLMQFARLVEAWNAAKHPRNPKGSPGGGRFRSGSAVGSALDGGAPDALDGFGREELRREARRRGISLRRGAPIDEIRDALHDSRRGKDSRSPEDKVRDAYKDLADSPGAAVSLVDLRERMSGMSRQEQDKTLREMAMSFDVVLWPEENQKTINAEDEAASIVVGGERKHLIVVDGQTSPEPPSAPAIPEVDRSDRAQRVATQLDILELPIETRGRWSVFGDTYDTKSEADAARLRVANRKVDEFYEAMETYRKRALAELAAERKGGQRP